MEHISGIITVTVIIGIISVCVSGHRLSGAVKLICSLIIMISVLSPLVRLLLRLEANELSLVIDEADMQYSDIENMYIEECRKQIEHSIVECLTYKFGNCDFSVVVELDTTDASSVVITSVTVKASDEATALKNQIVSFVKECTGCNNVTEEFKAVPDG